MDHVLSYVNQVLNGDIILAPENIKLACKRELDDRTASKGDNFPYYFDNSEAEKAIKFISLIPKTDGTPLEVASFQAWIIGSLAGWRRKDNHNRRYKDAFISMARKNGKTYLASALAIQALLIEQKPAKNRQVLFVSNALKQAKLGFEMMSSELRQLQRSSPYLRNKIDVKKKQITKVDDDSFAVALAGKPETLDGFAASGIAIIDEFHVQKDDLIVQAVKQGQVKEPNSLCCIISTSGYNLRGAMKKYYDHYTDVLNGKEQADTAFIAIWELDDPEEEVNNPKNWIKANPLFENDEVRAIMQPKLEADLTTAKQNDELQPFLVKNMNSWFTSHEASYINLNDWDKAVLKTKPSIRNKEVIFGVDLSKSNDLTSVSWLVPMDNGKYFADSFSFIATKYGLIEKIKADGIDYRALERAGECSITTLDSGLIDYDQVSDFISNMINRYNLKLRAIVYDPWQGGQLIGRLEKLGYPLLEIQQTEKILSEPTKRFKEAIISNQIKVSDNHLLRYAVDNAILHYNSTGAVRLDKMKNNEKIDPLAALINAYTHLINEERVKADNEYYSDNNFTF